MTWAVAEPTAVRYAAEAAMGSVAVVVTEAATVTEAVAVAEAMVESVATGSTMLGG